MGEFSLIEGRTAYSLIRAEVQNYFTELAMAQPEVYYGFYFLELADYYGREGMDESPMLNLLYLAVRALLNPHLDDRLVRRIFEMRAMTINGEYAPGGGNHAPGNPVCVQVYYDVPSAEAVYLRGDAGGAEGTGTDPGPSYEAGHGPEDEKPGDPENTGLRREAKGRRPGRERKTMQYIEKEIEVKYPRGSQKGRISAGSLLLPAEPGGGSAGIGPASGGDCLPGRGLPL